MFNPENPRNPPGFQTFFVRAWGDGVGGGAGVPRLPVGTALRAVCDHGCEAGASGKHPGSLPVQIYPSRPPKDPASQVSSVLEICGFDRRSIAKGRAKPRGLRTRRRPGEPVLGRFFYRRTRNVCPTCQADTRDSIDDTSWAESGAWEAKANEQSVRCVRCKKRPAPGKVRASEY